MKYSTILFFSGLMALSFVSYSSAIETGSAARDFTLNDTMGKVRSLSDFKGKYVVLEWTNYQCPFVAKHYSRGDMQALQKKIVDDNAVWLQIVSSAVGKQGYVTAEKGESIRTSGGHHSTAMLLDPSGDVGRTYRARTTPHMFLIDPDGVLVYQGAIDSIRSTDSADIADAENFLLSAYESARAGEPIAKSTTKPYGCSVKY